MINLREVFLDELGTIRSGWRILLFLLILFGVSAIIFFFAGIVTSELGWISPVLMLLSVYTASVIMIRLFEKRPIHSLGLPAHKRLPLEVVQGVVLGGMMISLVFLLQYFAGWVQLEWRGLNVQAVTTVLLSSFVLFLVAGLTEELLFRGYPFQILVESIKPFYAVLIMSVLFMVAHSGNPNIPVLGFLNIFLAGIWLAVGYLKTRTLWFPAGLHISWNFFQNTVYSYPVSGFPLEERTLFILNLSGPEILTGGAFGPEGGLLATGVLIGAIIIIHNTSFIKIGEGVWTVERYIREELERFAR
jgi:uncharacterized protein